ncbi:hypothetical protein [Flavobacterium sp. N1994]|uniref:hypothetical protein n=1 Tax=Flavobacterium sp. N1994 TaxID=2986827 RepID=UPI002222D7FC|nr:hypothetical protein [Flavobacterium sp. N1994]
MYFRVKILIKQYQNEHKNKHSKRRKYRSEWQAHLQGSQRKLGSNSRVNNTGTECIQPAFSGIE